jgi:hypothetical protein
MAPNDPQLLLEEAPSSILVLKPSSLGDVVHTLPAVSALKRRWPSASIRWLVNPEWAPLLRGNPAVDETLLFPRQSFRGLAGPWRLLQWARAFGPAGAADLVLDFQCLLRSALVGRFCRRTRFYGLSDAREGARFFYDATVPVHSGMHAVDRYLALVRAVGAPATLPLEWPLPDSSLPAGFAAEMPFVRHPPVLTRQRQIPLASSTARALRGTRPPACGPRGQVGRDARRAAARRKLAQPHGSPGAYGPPAQGHLDPQR